MPKPSQPALLDADQRQRICAALAIGCPLRTAADLVGCELDAVHATARRDRAFLADIFRAEARFEFAHIKNVFDAAGDTKNWRASTWALERRFPDRYGPRRPHVVTAEQLSQVLAQLADVVIQEVPVARHRARILERLADVVAALRTTDSYEADTHARG
jgi:hypothetical protein